MISQPRAAKILSDLDVLASKDHKGIMGRGKSKLIGRLLGNRRYGDKQGQISYVDFL
jgi:hypothetical protein